MGIAFAANLGRGLTRRFAARPAGVVSALALADRLLAPALAFAVASDRQGLSITLGALLAAVFSVRSLAQSVLTSRVEARLYYEAADSALRVDVLKASPLPDADARSALLEGLHRVAVVISTILPGLLANALASVVLLVGLVLYEPPRASLLAGCGLGVAASLLHASRGATHAAQTEAWAAWGHVADALADAYEGRLDLVASGRRDPFLARFDALTGTWSQRAVRAARVTGASGRLALLAVAVAIGALIAVDARFQGSNWSLALTHAAILTSSAPAFVGLAQCVQQLAQEEPRLALVARLFDEPASKGSMGRALQTATSRIDWVEVSFAYETSSAEVLHGISLKWNTANVLALTGPNGSGKTTCVRMLLALGVPKGGDILVDGARLSEADATRWRLGIAYLPQRPYLAPRASVRESLLFVDAGIPDDEMSTHLERVGVLKSLEVLSPEPLSVRVGSLSVGQRQRVALARMLCRDAPMVVLDEPDANLDQSGIELVAGLVRELARTRAVLIVAHSPELLAVADQVVVLEGGRVADERQPRDRSASRPTTG